MSDERSVEAHLLSLLTWSLREHLIDLGADSSCCNGNQDAVVPSHIVAVLQRTAECYPNPVYRRLAQLALAISDETGDSYFNSLAAEVCTSVYDVALGTGPMPNLSSLTRLLEEIEAFCGDFLLEYSPDQVQDYHHRLSCILNGKDNVNMSTSLQDKEAGLFAPRLKYPLSPTPTASDSCPSIFLDVAEPSGSNPTEPNGPIVEIPKIYLVSIFVYHIVLLRFPALYAAASSDTLCLDGESDVCALDLWDTFTGILLKQWKTLGLFSTLIFGASLTMFQIPSITTSALLRVVVHSALLCVVMSLVYTSLLSAYFGSWRSGASAEWWVQEMRTANPHTFWNFWVLISLPVVWTCWGIFLFLTSMVLFVWPLGEYDPSDGSSNGTVQDSLGARIFLSMVVFTGIVYLALAISKLRRVCNPVGEV